MNKSRDELPTTGRSLPPRRPPDSDRGPQFKMTQFFPSLSDPCAMAACTMARGQVLITDG